MFWFGLFWVFVFFFLAFFSYPQVTLCEVGGERRGVETYVVYSVALASCPGLTMPLEATQGEMEDKRVWMFL